MTIPAYIYRLIPANSLFKAELTDEGLLFRFMGTREMPYEIPAEEVPDWAKS